MIAFPVDSTHVTQLVSDRTDHEPKQVIAKTEMLYMENRINVSTILCLTPYRLDFCTSPVRCLVLLVQCVVWAILNRWAIPKPLGGSLASYRCRRLCRFVSQPRLIQTCWHLQLCHCVFIQSTIHCVLSLELMKREVLGECDYPLT